ncbi:hypothetical protein MC885_001706 [Smutsia gigantea]|nr:hypothetical protein MC885_001706 [Smutsia gigantea]
MWLRPWAGSPANPVPLVSKGLSLEATYGQRAVVKPEVRADGTRGGPEVFRQKRPEPGEGSALPSYGGSRVRDVRRCRGLSCPRAVSGSSELRSPDGCPSPGTPPPSAPWPPPGARRFAHAGAEWPALPGGFSRA